jgi:hypothetical protein
VSSSQVSLEELVTTELMDDCEVDTSQDDGSGLDEDSEVGTSLVGGCEVDEDSELEEDCELEEDSELEEDCELEEDSELEEDCEPEEDSEVLVMLSGMFGLRGGQARKPVQSPPTAL